MIRKALKPSNSLTKIVIPCNLKHQFENSYHTSVQYPATQPIRSKVKVVALQILQNLFVVCLDLLRLYKLLKWFLFYSLSFEVDFGELV